MSSKVTRTTTWNGAGARATAVVLIMTALAAVAPAALAAPPHGEGGHAHHVISGGGHCVPLDAVAFLPQGRGLHQGASMSGRERGPWHGPCS